MPLGRTLTVRAIAALLLLLAAPAGAATIVLDFEEEPIGYRNWDYVSLECGCVSFAYGSGPEDDDLAAIYDWGYPTGRALTWWSDHEEPLTLTFLSLVDSLSLDFAAGATDNSLRPEPWDGKILPGSEAVLTAFLGPTKVGETRVALDLVGGHSMDQVIGFSGIGEFDRVVLRYEAELGPAIDNVIFSTVPEPGTLGLFALVLIAARPRLRLRGRS